MSCYLFFFSWLVALHTFLPVLSADPITWQTPTVISTAGVNASDPRVGIAQNGTVIAAWIENGVVKSSSLPLNGSWSTPATLSGSGASSLRLGVSASGSAVALWLEGGAFNVCRGFECRITNSVIEV